MSRSVAEAFTATLKVSYRRPVPSGRPILFRVFVESVSGRKVSMGAEVSDGCGTVYADGHALLIQAA